MKAISLIINTRLTFFKLCAKNYRNQNLKKIKCVKKMQRTDIKNCNQQDCDFLVYQQIKCSLKYIFIVNVHSRKFYEVYLIAYCTIETDFR